MNNKIQVISKYALQGLETQDLCNAALAAKQTLESGSGAGNDFLGWLHLPSSIDEQQLASIEQTAAVLREQCEYVITIGIGGSYLGAKAVIEALSDHFAAYKTGSGPKVLFAGNNIGEDYLYDLMDLVRGHKFGIIVISKSGTTTEPAIAFRLFKEMLEQQEGKALLKANIFNNNILPLNAFLKKYERDILKSPSIPIIGMATPVTFTYNVSGWRLRRHNHGLSLRWSNAMFRIFGMSRYCASCVSTPSGLPKLEYRSGSESIRNYVFFKNINQRLFNACY